MSLTKIYETCQLALNGALHEYIDSRNSMTTKELKKFQNKATKIANQSFTDTINSLRAISTQISREARLKAHTDANKDAPNIIVADVDLSVIESLIKQEYINTVISGIKLAKKLMSQHMLLIASGTSVESARIRIRERNHGNILNVYSTDKISRKIRTGWSLYINTSAFLNQIFYHEYMMQAAKLGFTEFEISQPGHKRDGVKFSIDNVPEKELHPQSQASIKLIIEV